MNLHLIPSKAEIREARQFTLRQGLVGVALMVWMLVVGFDAGTLLEVIARAVLLVVGLLTFADACRAAGALEILSLHRDALGDGR